MTYRELTNPLDVATPIATPGPARGRPRSSSRSSSPGWSARSWVPSPPGGSPSRGDGVVGALGRSARGLDPRIRSRRSSASGLPLVALRRRDRAVGRSPLRRHGTRCGPVLDEGATRIWVLLGGSSRSSCLWMRRTAARRRRVRVAGGRLDGRRAWRGRGRSGGPRTAVRVTGAPIDVCEPVARSALGSVPTREVLHDDEDDRLRRLRRIGPVRPAVLPGVRRAARVRDRRTRQGRPNRRR